MAVYDTNSMDSFVSAERLVVGADRRWPWDGRRGACRSPAPGRAAPPSGRRPRRPLGGWRGRGPAVCYGSSVNSTVLI